MTAMKLSGVHFENGYLTHDDHSEDAITDWYKPYRSDEYAFPVVYVNRSYKAVVEWHKTQEAADARKIQIAGFGMWIEEYPEIEFEGLEEDDEPTPEGEDENGFENPDIVLFTRTCECGNAITHTNGWNDYNTILRCEACTERRQALLAEITSAIAGKNVETVYVSSDLRNLVSVNDFTTVEVSYRRAEKMAGQAFVVEA